MPASQSWEIRTPGLQQGAAIVGGPMCVVEMAGSVQEIAELRACETVLAAVYLAHAAASGLVLEHGPVAFGKLSVESTVMRDGDDRALREGPDCRVVEFVTGHHPVGDAVSSAISTEMRRLGS